MCKYLDKNGAFKGINEVPDPYYGGAKGFELVSTSQQSQMTRILQHVHCVWCIAAHDSTIITLTHGVQESSCMQVLDLLEDACEGLLNHIKEHDLTKTTV